MLVKRVLARRQQLYDVAAQGRHPVRIGCVDAITEIDERVEIAFARNGLNRDSRHAFPEALRKSGRSLLAFFTERAAARVAAGDPAGKLLHPRVGLRDFLVIAE